jgi:hypothetical protein
VIDDAISEGLKALRVASGYEVFKDCVLKLAYRHPPNALRQQLADDSEVRSLTEEQPSLFGRRRVSPQSRSAPLPYARTTLPSLTLYASLL